MEDYGFHLQTEEDLKPRKSVRLEVDPDEPIDLMLDLEDDPKGVRRGESGVISIIVHAVVIVLLLLWGKIFTPSVIDLDKQGKASAHVMLYLNEPAVQPRPPVQAPVLTKKDLDELRAAAKPPALPMPAPETPPPSPPPAPTPAPPKTLPQVPVTTPTPAPVQGLPNSTAPPSNTPPPPNPTPGEMHLNDVKPPDAPKLPVAPGIAVGQSLQDTLKGIAKDRVSGGGSQSVLLPPPGPVTRGPAQMSRPQILTDTQGVDFDPYLARILIDIRRNWSSVMPEAARMGKRGRVVLEFEIMRDGAINKVYLTEASGFDPYDKAAFAGLMASAPFPPLPGEFKGPMVRLRLGFFYNMPLQ